MSWRGLIFLNKFFTGKHTSFLRDGKSRNKKKHKNKIKQNNSVILSNNTSTISNHETELRKLHQYDNKNSTKLLKNNKNILKSVKNKIIRHIKSKADDKILLNNSFPKEESHKVFLLHGELNKKRSKRKRAFSETEKSKDTKPLLKKAKKLIKEPENEENTKVKKKKKNGSNKINSNSSIKINKDQQIKNINKKLKKKNSKRRNGESDNDKPSIENIIDPINLKKRKKQLEKLQKVLLKKQEKNDSVSTKKHEPILTLRQKMMRKLKAARFRFLNEQIYTTTSKETAKIFQSDPEAFKAYHEGYRQQVKRWPLNPLDIIIKFVKKMPKTNIIADFGCGEARLAKSVDQKVYSFDLVAENDMVTACDMAHVPLQDSSIDVAIFCLSLMGTNLQDYLLEANRVLKNGGLLKIAEVESRFEDINTFIKACEQFGFKKTWMDLSHNLFYFIDFRKEGTIKGKKKLPSVTLQPCLYKKR